MSRASGLWRWLLEGTEADRAVPPTGITAQLTVFTAGAMAFLTVFALALLVSTDRLADRWASELAQTATLRISAPQTQIEAQVARALTVLEQTPGVAEARLLDSAEQRALLEPWFGPDLPLDALALPRLIEITETAQGFDSDGLRLRLQAEVPGAVLDDHSRWRRPLVEAAAHIRMIGVLAIGLIAASTAALVVLAVTASLAANAQVIRVLRLVGARDAYVARAFVRRFTLRTLAGALVGTLAAMAALGVMPAAGTAPGFLTDLGFEGAEWAFPLAIPAGAGLIAFAATRIAAMRRLKDVP